MSQPNHQPTLSHAELLQLKRWNTPTIYNGWEQITERDRTRDGFNLEETQDYMPEMGPMVGYAVTVQIQPSEPKHRDANANAVREYREYVASQPGPKIVIVQDLDQPQIVGSYWGEVNANTHRALGCVGTITDGAIRDVDEMKNAGFKALARRLCVGHAYSYPVKWNCPVRVFGQEIHPGQLVHADKHGFLAVTAEEETRLLEAAVFMDQNECRTVIPAARGIQGKTDAEIIEQLSAAGEAFGQAAKEKFSRQGEW